MAVCVRWGSVLSCSSRTHGSAGHPRGTDYTEVSPVRPEGSADSHPAGCAVPHSGCNRTNKGCPGRAGMDRAAVPARTTPAGSPRAGNEPGSEMVTMVEALTHPARTGMNPRQRPGMQPECPPPRSAGMFLVSDQTSGTPRQRPAARGRGWCGSLRPSYGHVSMAAPGLWSAGGACPDGPRDVRPRAPVRRRACRPSPSGG